MSPHKELKTKIKTINFAHLLLNLFLGNLNFVAIVRLFLKNILYSNYLIMIQRHVTSFLYLHLITRILDKL